MSRLQLTLACGDYDRTRALEEGTVRPDGIDLTYLRLPVEETFFRMMRHREFDVAEMSLSSYVKSLDSAERPFVALPVYTSRQFRHAGVFVHADAGIAKPEDLRGRVVGTPEWQLTAGVWIRGILADQYGVPVESVEYRTGGQEAPGRIEKAAVDLGERIRIRPIPEGATLSAMLGAGELDAFIGPGSTQERTQARAPGVDEVREARPEPVVVRAAEGRLPGEVEMVAHDHERPRGE